MKTTTKCLALILAVLMSLSVFVACNQQQDDSGNNGNETTLGGGNNDETTGKTDEATGSPYVEDLEGYVYRAYYWDENQTPADGVNQAFVPLDFYCENLGDAKDPISVAVWYRNSDIEADYNCFFEPIASTMEHTTELTGLWNSGKKYDLAVIVDTAAAQCATLNLLTNLNNKPNLHLKEAFYDQNSVEQLSMGGVTYFISGDMNVSSLENSVVTIVNEKLYNSALQAGGEKPIYDIVKSGEWTMAKMMELAGKVNKDVGEDGAFSAEAGDIWGYLPYLNSALYHFYGCGGRITITGDDGFPTLSMGSDASKSAVTTVMDTINLANLPTGVKTVKGSDRNNAFSAEAVLFSDTVMYDVRIALYPTIQTWKYGILPMALQSSTQYNASSASLGHVTALQYGFGGLCLWTIPSFYNNIDNATTLFEAFAKYSARAGGTMEAYYTRTISLQAAKDENSRQMVELVKAGMAYDIGLAYPWGDFKSLLVSMISTNQNPLNSLTDAKLMQAQMEMEMDIENFRYPSSPEVE